MKDKQKIKREAGRAAWRRYYYRNRERLKDRHRDWDLRKKYNIGVEEYDKMFIKQKGQCAICKKASNGKRLAVDHCHTTGKVRGLLCQSCNNGLGRFKDLPFLLRQAADYLESK